MTATAIVIVITSMTATVIVLTGIATPVNGMPIANGIVNTRNKSRRKGGTITVNVIATNAAIMIEVIRTATGTAAVTGITVATGTMMVAILRKSAPGIVRCGSCQGELLFPYRT
jgi:hypothetical protein